MSTPYDYKVLIDEPAPETPCECSDGCQGPIPYSALSEIGDCSLTPGDPSPAGRCPECESLAYIVKAEPAGTTPPKTVELSECCHAEIGYDAWVNSAGEVNGGPFDDCICINCGMEEPEVWDGKDAPWPRAKREGQTDLPEGVEEPAP